MGNIRMVDTKVYREDDEQVGPVGENSFRIAMAQLRHVFVPVQSFLMSSHCHDL